jgi:hypothetical protein
VSTVYKKWRSRIQDGTVDLETLHADIESLESKIAAGEAELQAMRTALDGTKADLAALWNLRNFLVHGAASVPLGSAEATSGAGMRKPAPGRPRGSKRDAVLSILADGQDLHTSAIRKSLVDAGEIGSDQPSYHALQVTLSQMFRAGELARPARGVYRLPSVSDDEILQSMAYGP